MLRTSSKRYMDPVMKKSRAQYVQPLPVSLLVFLVLASPYCVLLEFRVLSWEHSSFGSCSSTPILSLCPTTTHRCIVCGLCLSRSCFWTTSLPKPRMLKARCGNMASIMPLVIKERLLRRCAFLPFRTWSISCIPRWEKRRRTNSPQIWKRPASRWKNCYLRPLRSITAYYTNSKPNSTWI